MLPGRGGGGLRGGRRPALPRLSACSPACLEAYSARPASAASWGFTQNVGWVGPPRIDELGP